MYDPTIYLWMRSSYGSNLFDFLREGRLTYDVLFQALRRCSAESSCDKIYGRNGPDTLYVWKIHLLCIPLLEKNKTKKKAKKEQHERRERKKRNTEAIACL